LGKGRLRSRGAEPANTTYTMDSGSSYRLTDAAGSTAIYVEGLPRTFKWR
jgi:hypothetical protein